MVTYCRCYLCSTTPALHCTKYFGGKNKKQWIVCFTNCIWSLMVLCGAAYCLPPLLYFLLCEVKETQICEILHLVSFLELSNFFVVYCKIDFKSFFQWNLFTHYGETSSILFEQFQHWSASIRTFLLTSYLLCFLCSCGTMTSRKKVLLKVIILGDSGWVTLSHRSLMVKKRLT